EKGTDGNADAERAADTERDPDEDRRANNNFEYPTEFLNTIKASGLPLAKLCLKIGCPIMVLRNLDPSNGLCNGSRGILTRIQPHVLEIRLLGGDHHGKHAFIPRLRI